VLPRDYEMPRPWVSFSTLALCLSSLTASVAASDIDSSPSADIGLICHTGDAAECYPRVFQAAEEFQKVHHDQELPKGLHVRLNVWTGEREAKLNNPDEQDSSWEGPPVDRAVVIVEPDSVEAEAEALPSGAPLYEPVGLVKAPSAESQTFHEALAALGKGVPQRGLSSFGRASQSRFDEALDNLEELSHDIYYGLKIAEDGAALQSLLCLMSTRDIFRVDRGVAVLDQAKQAAAIVAAAVQNNPTALRQVEGSWGTLSASNCSDDGEASGLKALLFGSLLGSEAAPSDNMRRPTPALVRGRLSAISGLLKSDAIKRDFLLEGGMKEVLQFLVAEGPEYEVARARAAHLVMDNFLDESMGATPGFWPTRKAKPTAACRDGAAEEECWDYHIERLAGEHQRDGQPHWSVELLTLLRQKAADGPSRDEL